MRNLNIKDIQNTFGAGRLSEAELNVLTAMSTMAQWAMNTGNPELASMWRGAAKDYFDIAIQS